MRIKHNKPSFFPLDDMEELAQVMQSSFVAYGEQGRLFENELCRFLHLPEGHCVLVSSGSAALYITLSLLGVKGKTVALPAYVCSSLRNAIALAGGLEQIIDVEPNYPNICIENLNKIRPDFAIIPHMFGIPVDLDKIDSSISIIEDCAQSIGAYYKTQPTGTIGTAGIFSFYATKLLTTGEGGAIVSKNKDFIAQVRDFIDFDCRTDKKIRFNFHLSDINSAIGRNQLRHLPSFLSRREEIFQLYKQAGLSLIEPSIPHCSPVRYRTVLRTDTPQLLKDKLLQHDIQTIIPIEERELLDAMKNAVHLSHSTLSLPCYPSLQLKQVESIIRILEDIC